MTSQNYPEDGGDISPQDLGAYLQHFTTSLLLTSDTHSENLKFHDIHFQRERFQIRNRLKPLKAEQ